MKNMHIGTLTWLRHFLSGSYFNRGNVWRIFPEFFQSAEEQTYPVPGLKKARSITREGGKATCLDMTPQGLTLTEDYLLISAYCHTHEHHSVIYVVDRRNGAKLKTILLPDLPHAGGLAYDPIHRKLWVSNTLGKNAAVAAITLEAILHYSEKQGPIAYEQKVPLKELPRASALTYDNGYLVVALFALKEHGTVVCYPIDADGNLTQKTNVSNHSPNLAPLASPFGSMAIPKKIQGVTFYKQFMLLSKSWGKQPGQIFIFDIHKTTDFSDISQAIKIIETPPYLEQIYVEGNTLFALFESGAAAYRKKTSFVVKEVLQLALLSLIR